MDDQARARDKGLSLLVGATIASLVWMLVYPFLYPLLAQGMGLGVSSFEIVERVMGGISLVIDVFAIVAWVSIARATPRSRVGLAHTTLAVLVIQLLPTIAFQVLGLGRQLGGAISHAWAVLIILELTVGWFALLRLGDETLRGSVRGLTQGAMAMVGVRGATLVVSNLITPVLMRDWGVGSIAQIYAALHYVRLTAAVVYSILLFVLVKRLRAQPSAIDDAQAPLGVEPVGSTPDADILWGVILLGGGLLVSVGSYVTAHSGGGGRYVFTTGLIGVGIGRLIRGLRRR
jgi:hypothetical protein